MSCLISTCFKPVAHKGFCRSHYMQFTVRPMIPVAPLLKAVANHHESVVIYGEITDAAEGHGYVSLYTADKFLCRVLKMHPSEVYGPDWFEPDFPTTEALINDGQAKPLVAA